ncbi:MAG TPA: hypothetical protein PK992_14885 [Planctomycetaceae bacterium]|nr:hypothetical protein [Planctomycetaceae bacterium]
MKKILGLGLYAAVMFGVTAGLGMFMLKKNASQGSDHADAEHSDSLHPATHGEAAGTTSGHVQTVDASAARRDGHSISGTDVSGDHRLDEQLPVAVRTSPMSIEEIVRMGLSLKSRDEILRQRESTLKETESQQRLIHADVESAQQVVENLLARANDQRAAIEELVGKMNAQQETVNRERQTIADDQQQLKLDRDKLDADRRQLEAQKAALAQSETDLQLKRRELDNDRKQFDSDRTKITLDGDKLVKDREKWVAEVERMNTEKQQLSAEKEQIRVERATLEQDKRLLASTPGAAALPAPKKPLDVASTKQNLKQLTEMFEGMSPETAASTIKVLSTNGETDMVVDVLVQLEQRKASAILDAIADEQLVSEFLIKINSRNSQPKSAKN